MSVSCCLQCTYTQTIGSEFQEFAKAATKQEIFDNCKVWVPQALQQAQQMHRPCWVSWDNASIHNFTEDLGGLAALNLTQHQHIVLPARSPDLHQIIEKCFARLKADLVASMYKVGWDQVTPEWVAQWVIDWCEAIKAETIQDGLNLLPKLYTAVSTPKGQVVYVDGSQIAGTDGGYAKKSIS